MQPIWRKVVVFQRLQGAAAADLDENHGSDVPTISITIAHILHGHHTCLLNLQEPQLPCLGTSSALLPLPFPQAPPHLLHLHPHPTGVVILSRAPLQSPLGRIL